MFSGTSSPANDVGTYFFNSNNTGEIAIQDTPSGKIYAFGIVAGLGNGEFQGASIFGSPGVQKDPLIITIQKRDQTITAAQFNSQDNVAFDPAGGSAGGSGLGKGFDAVALGVEEHFDPETGTTPEGGGSIFFNVDGGYDSDIAPGVQLFPSSLVVDFHESILAQHTGDGTQEASASLNSDYMNPLAGAAFQTASVLWGTTNQNAYTATIGSGGVPSRWIGYRDCLQVGSRWNRPGPGGNSGSVEREPASDQDRHDHQRLDRASGLDEHHNQWCF